MADNAENLFDSLRSSKDVTALVGKAEDLYFEAKTCSVPLRDDDKTNLATALSGFANSDGGVLVFGLHAPGGDKATADVVKRPKPLSNLSKAHSEVLALVGQIVEPPVEGVRAEARPIPRLEDRGYLVVLVPRSGSRLHRSRRDREFYRRHGACFLGMEHYEIEEFYGRRKSPLLALRWSISSESWSGNSPNRLFDTQIQVGIENIGRGIAKYPALRIKNHLQDAFGLSQSMQNMVSRDSFFFRGGADVVVYPGSVLNLGKLQETYKINEAMPSWPSIAIQYELYAENMETTEGSIAISDEDFLKWLRSKK